MSAGGALQTSIAAALSALIAAARRKPPLQDFALLTATLTFLVLPYGFNYDLTVVMVGALAIVVRNTLPPGWRLLGAMGFLAHRHALFTRTGSRSCL